MTLGEGEDEPVLGVVTLEILGLFFNPLKRTLEPMRMLLFSFSACNLGSAARNYRAGSYRALQTMRMLLVWLCRFGALDTSGFVDHHTASGHSIEDSLHGLVLRRGIEVRFKPRDAQHSFDQGIGIRPRLPFIDHKKVNVASYRVSPSCVGAKKHHFSDGKMPGKLTHPGTEPLNDLRAAQPWIRDPHKS